MSRRAPGAKEPGASAGRPARKRVVVIGEFNSGKTALVNAILGAQVLAPSPITHTVHPTVISYAARPSATVETAERKRVRLSSLEDAPTEGVRRLHLGLPLLALQSLSLIDMPGLAVGDEDADPRTLAVCSTAHDVVWCTPAVQAWKASEEQIWLALPARVRARGILAVTFADLVPPGDLDRLLARLKREAAPFFRTVLTVAEASQFFRPKGEHHAA